MIIFGSDAASIIIKDSYLIDQENTVGLYMEDALQVATRINMDGHDLAEWFITAVDLCGYERLEGFMDEMVTYAIDNNIMPQAYYDLVKFKHLVTQAINGPAENDDE